MNLVVHVKPTLSNQRNRGLPKYPYIIYYTMGLFIFSDIQVSNVTLSVMRFSQMRSKTLQFFFDQFCDSSFCFSFHLQCTLTIFAVSHSELVSLTFSLVNTIGSFHHPQFSVLQVSSHFFRYRIAKSLLFPPSVFFLIPNPFNTFTVYQTICSIYNIYAKESKLLTKSSTFFHTHLHPGNQTLTNLQIQKVF